MPFVGVVCGSGLGTLADALENRVDLTQMCLGSVHLVIFVTKCYLMIALIVLVFLICLYVTGYGDDSFPVYYETIRGVPCIILGKSHFYQGHTPQQTALPIVLMKAFGQSWLSCRTLQEV